MRLALAIVWVFIIAILHAIPGHDIPSVDFADFFQLDKLVHAVIFCIGIYLFATALVEYQKKHFKIYLVVLFIAYGFLLEVLQELIFIQRSAELLDWLADSIGAFLGIVIFNKFPFAASTISVKKD